MNDEQRRYEDHAVTAARIAKQAFAAGWRACEYANELEQADDEVVRRWRERWSKAAGGEWSERSGR
jgi:hypothetical protein